MKPYGYVVELKTNYNSWTAYNRKVLHSEISAIDCAIKIIKKWSTIYSDYRIIPLYMLNTPLQREIKINKIVGNDLKPNQFEIKSWKLTEDFDNKIGQYKNYKLRKGTLFIQLENGRIIIGSNFSEKHRNIDYNSFHNFLINDKNKKNPILKECDLTDEKWMFPHLLKELKDKLIK